MRVFLIKYLPCVLSACSVNPRRSFHSEVIITATFKSYTGALEDQRICDRINSLIDSAADQPCALEIRYHHKCWLKYVCLQIPENG